MTDRITERMLAAAPSVRGRAPVRDGRALSHAMARAHVAWAVRKYGRRW